MKLYKLDDRGRTTEAGGDLISVNFRKLTREFMKLIKKGG